MTAIKKRLKILPPTLREPKRYLAFEVVSGQKFNFNAVSEAIIAKAYEFLGTLGMSRANIALIKDCWNPELQRGIIKVHTKHLNELRAVLALVDKISNTNATVRSIGVSGILLKAKQRYIQ